MAAATPALSVRELLELERQLYQESVDRAVAQLADLQRGELEDFVRRCAPFAADQRAEAAAALARRRLSESNGRDLCAFELKQADDVFQAQRRELKASLLAAARQTLAELEAQVAAEAAGAAAGGAKEGDEEAGEEAAARKREAAECKRMAAEDTLTTREALERALEDVRRRVFAAFNLQHVASTLPTAAAVAADVLGERERLHRKREQFAQAPPDAVTLEVNVDAQELTIEHPDTKEKTTFRAADFVVLSSQLSDEDFYGQIVALDDDHVRLVLICGTPARATLAALRSRRCALKHQHAPQDLLLFDEREVVSTKRMRRASQLRKRGRRRRTVDIRRGF